MSIWEVLFLVCVVVSIAALVNQNARPKNIVGALVGAAVLAATVFIRPQTDAEMIGSIPQQVRGEKGFVSSDACRSCHPSHHSSWHDSYHRTMTQIASPKSVLAPFNDIQLTSGNRSFELKRRGDEYWIRAPRFRDARVVMTTGSHHLQAYWVKGRRNRDVFLFPWVFHISSNRWMPFEHSFLVDPKSKQATLRWNDNCIVCHSVDGRPKLDFRGSLETEVAEFGIACESCHGPGQDHIRKHQNPFTRYQRQRDGQPDSSIINPARLSHRVTSQICGQCHSNFVHEPPPSKFWGDGPTYRAGGELTKTRRLVLFAEQKNERNPFHGSYWNEGTPRIGGREYLGLIASPCFQRGKMSCLSCHSMHTSDPNDQLAARMDGNHACTQCHQKISDNLESHTHHKSSSSGSRCYNCHMPHTSYALFKGIRSHRIVSPSTANLKSDRPNACNLCHLDRSLKWTADQLVKWYDMPKVNLNADQQSTAASLLWLLKGDAAQRVVTAWNMGQPWAHEVSQATWQAPFLAQLLEDPYSAVRFVAHEALRKLPGFQQFRYDFIGSTGQRAQARENALAIWRRRKIKVRNPHSILMNERGALNEDKIRALLKQRNDKPTTLPE